MTRFFALALAALALGACSATDPDSGIRSGQAAALAAPAGGGFVLYSLRTDEIVTDSAATTAWDIGFRGTEIILNGGTSGPGAGVGAVLETPFSAVTDGRLDDVVFRRDGESACPVGPPRAVCAGSASGLFAISDDGTVAPVPDRTLVVRLGDNSGFAKVEITDYTGDEAGGVYGFRYTANVTGSSFVEE